MAHGLTRGFTKVPEIHHHALHGEMVAFGLIAQCVLEKRPPETLDDLLEFYGLIGLPRCFAEMGLPEPTAQQVRDMARWSCGEGSPTQNMLYPVDEAALAEALAVADRLGRESRNPQPKKRKAD